MKKLLIPLLLFAPLMASEPKPLTYSIQLESTLTIQVSTNVVYGDNTIFKTVKDPTRFGIEYVTIQHPMTERWWITNVVATYTLTFPWRGTNRTIVDTELMSSVTNRQVLKEYWKTEE